MQKPIRIVTNDRIRGFNEKVRGGLEHALNFMLGTGDGESKITISSFDPFLMPIETYLSAYKKKSVLVKVHAEKDYTGEFYWFFELKSAIVLGCLMRAMPQSALDERVKTEKFDETDQDAFGEVGNQLCGILDRAFRSLTSKNIHLRMDFQKKVYPDESIQLSTFIDKEEYVVLLTSMTIPAHGAQKLTLLLPRSLYETMLNLEIALEGITPKQVLLYSPDQSRVERLQTLMNSRYLKIVPLTAPEDVITAVEKTGAAAVGIELKKLDFPLPHQDNIFFKRLSTNRIFTRTPYLISWEGADQRGAAELKKLGINGLISADFEKDFMPWALAITAATDSTPKN